MDKMCKSLCKLFTRNILDYELHRISPVSDEVNEILISSHNMIEHLVINFYNE